MRKGTQFGTPQRSASISSDKNGKTDPVQALIAGAQPSSKVAKLDVSGIGKLGSCILFSFLFQLRFIYTQQKRTRKRNVTARNEVVAR